MRAVVFNRPGVFELSDVPEPLAGPGQLVVRVLATTICATDVKIFHGFVPFIKYPHIPGHEWGGEVVAIGAGVMGFAPGDLVGVEAHVGCTRCVRCAEGLYNLCENYGNVHSGHAHIGFTVPGGLAEYCAIPARAAFTLPAGLNADHAAFTDTIGIVLWAFERAGGVRSGESVAILGPGALGLLAVQIARLSGAGQVIAVGAADDSSRLALASKLGADETVHAREHLDPVRVVRDRTGDRGADLVIEFAGSAQAGRQALEMARRGGRVVLAGATSPGKQLQVDLSVIVRGHLDVFGSVANPRSISGRANTLMQKGLVDIQPLITHRFPLEEFSRAWETFVTRTGDPIRILMMP